MSKNNSANVIVLMFANMLKQNDSEIYTPYDGTR